MAELALGGGDVTRDGGLGEPELCGDILDLHPLQIVQGQAIALTVGQLMADRTVEQAFHPLALGTVGRTAVIEQIRDDITALLAQRYPLMPHGSVLPLSRADAARCRAAHDRSRDRI